MQRRRLDGYHPVRAACESPRPRPVPATDVEHGAPGRTGQLADPANLRLESQIGDAHQPHQQRFGQAYTQTRRDGQRAIPFCRWPSGSWKTTRSRLARTTRAPGNLARVARLSRAGRRTDRASRSGPSSTTTKRTPAFISSTVSGPRVVTIRFSLIDAALSCVNVFLPTSRPSFETTSSDSSLVQGA